MAFIDQAQDPRRRRKAIIAVATIHAVLAYGLVSGLGAKIGEVLAPTPLQGEQIPLPPPALPDPTPPPPDAAAADPVAPVADAVPESEAVREPEPVELPRTASPLPLFAVGGLGSLLAGLGLGLLRRRLG